MVYVEYVTTTLLCDNSKFLSKECNRFKTALPIIHVRFPIVVDKPCCQTSLSIRQIPQWKSAADRMFKLLLFVRGNHIMCDFLKDQKNQTCSAFVECRLLLSTCNFLNPQDSSFNENKALLEVGLIYKKMNNHFGQID